MYLAIGMTHKDFYKRDPRLCIAYRKADEMKYERINFEAWLNGLYVYNAFSVVMSNAFKKKGGKNHEYLKEPIKFKGNEQQNTEEYIEKQKELDKAKITTWFAQLKSLER